MDKERVVVPVVAEELDVSKERVARERVHVTTKISTHDEPLDMTLQKEELRIDYVKVGRVVEHTSAPRQEGDTLIVPVYEEVLFVEKRIVLREEVHLTRVRRDERVQDRVALRREEVAIEREKLDDVPGERPGPHNQPERGERIT